MFRPIFLLTLVLAGTLFVAESSAANRVLYFWRDAQGGVHYADVCPAGATCRTVSPLPRSRPAISADSSGSGGALATPGTPLSRSRLAAGSPTARGGKPTPPANPSTPPAPPAPTPPVTVGPIPPAPPAPQVLWSAGMETGDLSQWSEQNNSGSASSVAVTAFSAGIPPKTGNWVMRQSVTGSVGGTRMTRYPEVNTLVQAGTTFYVSWWDYYPTRVSFAPSDQFAIFQLGSRDAAGGNHPIWALYLHGSNSTPMLVYGPNHMAPSPGPHAGEPGSKVYATTQVLPIGEWVFFEVMITPSSTFSGAIKVWMNGQVLFDQSLVKTRFPDGGAGGFQWFDLLAYGSGLTPTPYHHYVDDVTVSLGRMP